MMPQAWSYSPGYRSRNALENRWICFAARVSSDRRHSSSRTRASSWGLMTTPRRRASLNSSASKPQSQIAPGFRPLGPRIGAQVKPPGDVGVKGDGQKRPEVFRQRFIAEPGDDAVAQIPAPDHLRRIRPGSPTRRPKRCRETRPDPHPRAPRRHVTTTRFAPNSPGRRI